MAGIPASTASLRAANTRRVLEALRRGPASQADLARRTGLSPATVSAIVRTLTAAGSVQVSVATSNGRRANRVRWAWAAVRWPPASTSTTGTCGSWSVRAVAAAVRCWPSGPSGWPPT
ncbi:MarR family transcriptional regulator [Fodinicola feengrottensis]|uniref:MarR family transcriptional regulator n=1 Tax=Fodinicola feengrottensis TaxID=435914 RepID=UPI00244250E0|nr:MarR family transcriptional regulator [Fodinicola feengrottensis]